MAISQPQFARTLQIAEKHINNDIVAHLLKQIKILSEDIVYEYSARMRYSLFSPNVKALAGDQDFYPFLEDSQIAAIRQQQAFLIDRFAKLKTTYDVLVVTLNGYGENIKD